MKLLKATGSLGKLEPRIQKSQITILQNLFFNRCDNYLNDELTLLSGCSFWQLIRGQFFQTLVLITLKGLGLLNSPHTGNSTQAFTFSHFKMIQHLK